VYANPQEGTATFGLTRRVWLSATLLPGVWRSAGATSAALPLARSLPDELAQALQIGNPLVVLVSLAGCPFCKTVRENYLNPLREQQGLPVVQVDMRGAGAVQDFKGAGLTHDALVHAWGVTVAPTVLFFGRSGAEVAPRLEGIGSPDYYGAVLDDRLAQAQKAIKSS